MLQKRFKNTIIDNNLFKAHEKIIVGVSAGPDSVALLSLLRQIDIPLSLVAVYVGHGLRPDEVKNEIMLVRRIAAQFNLPHEIVHVDVKSYKEEHKTSLEEAARILRYDTLEKCRITHNAAVIAVAHTADDQAEEILLRLIRGTGLRGLSGMRLKNKKIVRPLLMETKESLTRYLENSHISYCFDSSNDHPAFLRNRIRLDLLPLLEQKFNPAIRTNLLQTANILQQDENFLAQHTEMAYAKAVTATPEKEMFSSTHISRILLVEPFLQCHESIKRRILEKICWQLEARPSFRQIGQLCKLAEMGASGAEFHLKAGLRVFKTTGKLHFTYPCGKRKMRGNAYHQPLEPLLIDDVGTFKAVDLGMILTLGRHQRKPEMLRKSTLLLDADKVSFPLVLRPFNPGERFIPSGMNNRKKISKFLSDLKIPRQVRHLHPVLVSDNVIAAVIGLRIDERYAIDKHSTNFLQVSWVPSKTDKERDTG